MLGVTRTEFLEIVEAKDEACKYLPKQGEPGFWTPREFLIKLSEEYIKPNYGIEFFGHNLARRMAVNLTGTKITTISDSGFYDEAVPIVERFLPSNCTLIRIHRRDHDFYDSRGYINLDRYQVKTFDIHNDYDLNIYEFQVCAAVEKGTGYQTSLLGDIEK